MSKIDIFHLCVNFFYLLFKQFVHARGQSVGCRYKTSPFNYSPIRMILVGKGQQTSQNRINDDHYSYTGKPKDGKRQEKSCGTKHDLKNNKRSPPCERRSTATLVEYSKDWCTGIADSCATSTVIVCVPVFLGTGRNCWAVLCCAVLLCYVVTIIVTRKHYRATVCL